MQPAIKLALIVRTSKISLSISKSVLSILQLAPTDSFPYAEAMEVHFAPDLQAKLDQLATETGRPTGELVEDVVAGYFDELAQTREMLNSRYDDLKSGRVKPTSRDEIVAHFREKSAAAGHLALRD